MREISVAEAEMVSGGQSLPMQVLINVGSAYLVRVLDAIWQGPPPTSPNTGEFRLVGPGSRYETDAGSVGAVNGADKQSDTFAADISRRELDKVLTF